MAEKGVKKVLTVLEAGTLRQLIDKVNALNANDSTNNILKDDVLALFREDGVFYLLYYK
jgi:hypothetical protein